MFIFNINTTEFVLFIKGNFTLFFFFSSQTFHFWIQPTVLDCLVGHRHLCWLVPSKCIDSGNLSFCTLKALTCSVLVNHSTSSSREGTCIQIWPSESENPLKLWKGRMFIWKQSAGSLRYWSWYFLNHLSVSHSHESPILNCWKQSALSKRSFLICRQDSVRVVELPSKEKIHSDEYIFYMIELC